MRRPACSAFVIPAPILVRPVEVGDNFAHGSTSRTTVHTFVGLVLRKRGSQTIAITDTLNSSLTASVLENVT
jgi:hypothetical protein